MKNAEELINTELLEIFRKDKYLKELAKIYVDNCGISIAYRSVAFDLFCDYLEDKYDLIDLEIVVDYFNILMDDIDIVHRNYDISFNIPEEEYERIKEEINNLSILYK